MATHSTTASANMASASAFERFAGLSAILAGLSGLLYAISFVVLKSAGLSALFLMLGGLLTIPALTGLYSRVREAEPGFAMLALLLGVAGALGALLHGGYDLANVLNPPAVNFNLANLPSSVDPRGLLTFGVTGLGVLAFAWLLAKSGLRGLSYLGYLLAVLLIVLYLGRLIILDPKNPLIAVVALISGFIVSPVWYVWLGSVLWKGRKLL